MLTVATVGLAICFVLTSANAASLSEPKLELEPCSWGAQYWCSSPETADLCGKTKWCSDNDWSHDVIQDFSCTVTQRLVKYTRSIIKNAAVKPVSEQDYALFIAKGCVFFKDDNSRQKCKELATEKDVLVKLVKLVGSKLSGQAVSIAVGVCKRDIPTETPCPRCADVVSIAQKYIGKFLTEDAYMKLVTAQCAKLKLGTQLCMLIGQDKFKDFYHHLVNSPAQTLCDKNTKCLGLSTKIQGQQSFSECGMCTAVVSEIRQLDRNQEMQAIVKNLFKSVCTKLGEFNQVCDILVEEGLQYLFEFIATEMEPDVICEEVKMCVKSEQKLNQPTVMSSSGCGLCKVGVELLDVLILANATEEDLRAIFKSICDRLPPPLDTECNGFVLQYSQNLINLLKQKLDPNVICAAFGLCNKTAIPQFKVQPRKVQPVIAQTEICQLCELVVTYLDAFLAKNSSEAEAVKLLKQLCSYLPQEDVAVCNTLVDQYGPLIYHFLQNELAPRNVCIAIRLCSANSSALTQPKLHIKKLFKPNDAGCTVCKSVVSYVDTFLEKGGTQAEIEIVVGKVCKLIPSEYVQLCEAIVKQYTPMLIKLIEAEVQPGAMCNDIGICNPNQQAVTLVRKPDQLGDECDECKYVFNLLETYLQANATEVEIEALLEEICTLVPADYVQTCKSLIDQYTPLIIQLLLAEVKPDTVCRYLGFCSNNKKDLLLSEVVPLVKIQPKVTEPKVETKRIHSPEDCSVCKFVITYLETYLENNATVPEIEAVLDKVCAKVPVNFTASCIAWVKEYTPLIVQLLEYELKPQEFCTSLGFCTQNKQASQKIIPLPKVQSQPNAQSQLKVKSQLKDMQCDLCKYVVNYLDTFIDKNSTEAEVDAALNKLCGILPETFKTPCLDFVILYGHLIFEYIQKETDPNTLCALLGLCPSNKQVTISQSRVTGELCPLCQIVIKELYSILEKNATKTEIVVALDKVCKELPAGITAQCEAFVQLYLPYIVDLAVTEITPDAVCVKLTLCSAAANQVSMSQAPYGSEGFCTLCQNVFTYAYSYLRENPTEAEIEAALDKVCDVLPATTKDECISFVALYTPFAVDYIVAKYPPNTICVLLGLCSNEAHKVSSKSLMFKSEVSPVGSPPPIRQFCSLCKFSFYTMQSSMGDPYWANKTKEMLYYLCTYLGSKQQECRNIMDQNFNYIINAIMGFRFPQVFCQLIALCEPAVESAESCQVCERSDTMVRMFVLQFKTLNETLALSQEICRVFYSDSVDMCLTGVQQYTQVLYQQITQHPYDDACQSTARCPNTTQVTQNKVMRSAGGK